MTRPRDSQRSAVYAWERAAVPEFYTYQQKRAPTVEDVIPFVERVWRAERGRYGLAKRPAPVVTGGRGAASYGLQSIRLAPWARTSQAVILHELAHSLDSRPVKSFLGLFDVPTRREKRGGGHGPRFVGIFIGLLARHLGLDADALMAHADERGVRYDVRAIGAVPVIHLADRLAKALPCSVIEGAVELGVSYRQVQGAALRLVRQGRARYWRGKIVPRESVQPVEVSTP
jgi:hypothetical protein